MRTAIPAQPGYALIRVFADGHEVVPVIAFIVDPDSPGDPEPVPVFAAFVEPEHEAIVFPGGRAMTSYQSEFENVGKFLAACERITARKRKAA